MKNILKLSAILLMAVALPISCVNEEDPSNVKGFSIDKTDISRNPDGGTDTIRITSSEPWTAEVFEPWVKIDPANGNGSMDCQVYVDSSVVNTVRQTDIRFTCGSKYKELHVTQVGYDMVICLDSTEMNIKSSLPKKLRCFERKIVTNVPEFSIRYLNPEGKEIDWVSNSETSIRPDLEYGARPANMKVRFEWDMNTEPNERVATVNFIPKGMDKPLAVLTVNQEAAPVITDDHAGDSLALMMIQEKLNRQSKRWDSSELLSNWHGVVLWKDGDSTLPCQAAVGRVRSLVIRSLHTEETVPSEVARLKYLESLQVASNVSTIKKSIDLGPEIPTLKYLKHLSLYSLGLVSLPDNFADLGATLEYLDLNGNQFNEVPEVICQENFPKLKALEMVGEYRWTTLNLSSLSDPRFTEKGPGLHIDTRKNDFIKKLLTWDTIELLRLSNNLFEGTLPDFKIGEVVDGKKIEAYSREDLKDYGDTLDFLLNDPKGKKIPRILPKARYFSINLCYLTGKIPDWLLYHPKLIEFSPEILIYNQRNYANSEGKMPGFENEPANWEYYFNAYPKYRAKYEFNEEKEDNE